MTLHTLGVIALTLYIVYSIVFEDWKSKVPYPRRSNSVILIGLAFDVFICWLLITVVF